MTMWAGVSWKDKTTMETEPVEAKTPREARKKLAEANPGILIRIIKEVGHGPEVPSGSPQ